MKSTCQKIEDVDNPVVGKFYLVPCVWQTWRGMTRRLVRKGGWWPVIGPWHEDADIGFEPLHYHYDVRFFPAFTWRNGKDKNMARVFTGSTELNLQSPAKVVYFRMKMLREMPDFPSEESDGWGMDVQWKKGTKNKVVREVEEKFSKVRMTCMRCPHRGMSLKGLPIKDGMVVCNGHGLRWNVETGAMVVR